MWLQAEEQGVVAIVDGWCDVTTIPVGAEVKLVGTGEKKEAERKKGPEKEKMGKRMNVSARARREREREG